MKKGFKKSSVVLMTVMGLLVGSFTTAYAAESFKFTIVRNVTATTGDDQVWKSKSGAFAKVTVKSASSPSSYTAYKVYNYDTKISDVKTTQNKTNNSVLLQYDSGSQGKDFWVNLRAVDPNGTAPNYSTVSGNWEPTH